mmetsp:Transcript_10141/g.10101  ORF Transcript_10141/g.10101 Transcript_10141/m.10101 type:complete len:162 (+) Transcript_10141:514-999(+)
MRGLSEDIKKQIASNGLKGNYNQYTDVNLHYDYSPQSIATYNQQREYYRTDLSYRTGVSQERQETGERQRFLMPELTQDSSQDYLGGPRNQSFEQKPAKHFVKNLVMKQRKESKNGSESNLHQLPVQASGKHRNAELYFDQQPIQVNTQTSSLITLGDKKN